MACLLKIALGGSPQGICILVGSKLNQGKIQVAAASGPTAGESFKRLPEAHRACNELGAKRLEMN